MIPLTLNEIAHTVNGRVLNATGEELVIAPAFIDTRKTIPGGIFIALMGEHLDGHQFAVDAIQGGAVAALLTRDMGVPSVQASEPASALQLLATHVRSSLPKLKVVGITGSQGKTTTKDLLLAVLSSEAPTIAPPGNLNNELGVPLTLLRCSESTRYCILEMGARHPGDIAKLANLAQVDIGAVLNIGSAHVGEFGSDLALARAKGELIAALKPDGTAILGTYDLATRDLARNAPCRVVTFGETGEANLRAERVSLVHGRPSFHLAGGSEFAEVHLKYYGRHQVANALAVAAIATELGIGLSRIASALSSAIPTSRWRMEVRQRNGVTVINDAYNANPESMAAAIELLAEWAEGDGRPSWAVLGQMHELGASSDVAHQLIGRLVAQRGVKHLLVVGSGAGEILNGARGMAIADAEMVADSESALRYLRDRIEPEALILVKASRAEGLENLALEMLGDQA